jgi:hypothetical protein
MREPRATTGRDSNSSASVLLSRALRFQFGMDVVRMSRIGGLARFGSDRTA